jgi:DNA end-binding protein Ku
MPRAIWKGAITFGLVHVPVGLHSASQEQEIDFDWIDRRSNDPVGYKRVNKRTGREVPREDIVRGVKQKSGKYVLLSDDEIRAAFPRTTQTIEIEQFVDAAEIPLVFLERPYYVVPTDRGEKVYALLREAMRAKQVAGIARVVIRTKEHLAALLPTDDALVLNTLRWPSEIRSTDRLALPAAGRSAAKLKPGELKSAGQLIEHLTASWKPDRYADEFTTAIRKLVARKSRAGKEREIEPLEEAPEPGEAANVVDLTELLRESLSKRQRPPARASKRRSSKRARRRRA